MHNGSVSPLQGLEVVGMILPRALPWADLLCPFGAERGVTHWNRRGATFHFHRALANQFMSDSLGPTHRHSSLVLTVKDITMRVGNEPEATPLLRDLSFEVP